ncbi:hypothetical protein N7530_006008 [Penicillium desertorum]|uniref:Uncharacterized protein n=1 Tax=Penicillium desertorum TaxID=1303715 RepID=A0A9X0BRX0_9EURO|nr:hypothetical protein N7530_006008 [Penicillium desertorum]
MADSTPNVELYTSNYVLKNSVNLTYAVSVQTTADPEQKARSSQRQPKSMKECCVPRRSRNEGILLGESRQKYQSLGAAETSARKKEAAKGGTERRNSMITTTGSLLITRKAGDQNSAPQAANQVTLAPGCTSPNQAVRPRMMLFGGK